MNRWVILAGYMLLTACTQLVWLSFAPVTDAAAREMGVSVGQVGWLSAIFAGLYLLLGLPAGRWVDQHFGRALGFGAVCNAVGVLLRLLAPHNFAVQMAGQLILSVGQPFVVNAMSALAQRYFPAAERPKAIAAGSASMFLGVLLASVSAPPLNASGGLARVLLGHAVPTVLAAVWMLVALRTPPAYDERPTHPGETPGLGWLRNDRLLWLLGTLLFVGFGLFAALSTWLEALLGHFGIGAVTSGNLLGGMVVGGIVGAALLPVVAASRGWRKSLLGASLLVSIALLGVLWAIHGVGLLAVALVVAGFFLLACLPIILEWAEEHVGPTHQGTAVGFLMLAGNAGSLVLMLLVGAAVEHSAGQALGLLAVAGVLGLLTVTALPREARAGH